MKSCEYGEGLKVNIETTVIATLDKNAKDTWAATLEGQLNVRDAVRGTIEHVSPDGRKYRLNPQVATLLVRPRGWHLPEKHLLVDGEPMSASLFDFGLYFFHNAHDRIAQGSGI